MNLPSECDIVKIGNKVLDNSASKVWNLQNLILLNFHEKSWNQNWPSGKLVCIQWSSKC